MERAKIFFILFYLYVCSLREEDFRPYFTIINKKFGIFCLMQCRNTCDKKVIMTDKFNPKPAIILGMHDAIVSLLGLIAGLYFAFTDTNIIIISCIIASITAALSMGAANYLAVGSTDTDHALKSGFWTGMAYLATCACLILPFFIFHHQTIAIVSVFLIAILIIYLFNLAFYRGHEFYRHFSEMLTVCTIISIVAFLIGEAAHYLFGI